MLGLPIPDSFSMFVKRYLVDPVLIPFFGGPTSCPSPEYYFETCFVCLIIPGFFIFVKQNLLSKILPKRELTAGEKMVNEQKKPDAILTFQRYYLPVFWLMRLAFWMSGPFFYPVYSSKSIDGQPISQQMITNIFHFGFGTAALLLPGVASLVSRRYTDEKTGTIAAAVFYALGAMSVAVIIPADYSAGVLLAGRALGSIGTVLLSVMPEAWLSSEVQKSGADPYGRWLSSTFATAYAFDSLVAIFGGQIASWAAANFEGPAGPFMVSPLFLVLAIVIVGLLWTDTDVPTGENKDKDQDNGLQLKEAVKTIFSDSKIILVGLIQCSFEAAMYVFILNQSTAIDMAVTAFFAAGDSGASGAVPSGVVFCCYMACCLLGSSFFGYLADHRYRPERLMTFVLPLAALALFGTSVVVSDLSGNGGGMGGGMVEVSVSFFVFELCVGIYYPCISWLRSKYLPVAHRSIIMTIFSVPFNVLVLTISLFASEVFGVVGAWQMASVLILLATLCVIQLQKIAKSEAVAKLPITWKRVRAKWVSIARVMQIRKLVQGIAKQAAEEDYN